MQIFSRGNLYIGLDDYKSNTFFVHIGRMRVEYTCPSEHKGASTQPTDRQDSEESS